MGNSDIALLIPLAAILLPFLIVSIIFYFNHKGKKLANETIQKALDQGQELTPEIVDKLLDKRKPPENQAQVDLRRGVILIGVGLGFVAFGFTKGINDLIGIGLFLSVLGSTFIFLSKNRKLKNKINDKTSQ